MNKSFLVAIALGSVLSACSSNPSDLRPSNKVSLDQVPSGSRDTDIYNMSGENTEATHGNGHDTHGTTDKATEQNRPDVMLQGDQHGSDIGGNDQVPAEEKTNEASQVENHN